MTLHSLAGMQQEPHPRQERSSRITLEARLRRLYSGPIWPECLFCYFGAQSSSFYG